MMLPSRRLDWQALCSLLVACTLCSQAPAQKKPEKNKAARPVRPALPIIQFDEQLFPLDHNPSAVRRRWELTLELEITNVERVCQLTPGQSKKLQLAGTGDIVAFFHR